MMTIKEEILEILNRLQRIMNQIEYSNSFANKQALYSNCKKYIKTIYDKYSKTSLSLVEDEIDYVIEELDKKIK